MKKINSLGSKARLVSVGIITTVMVMGLPFMASAATLNRQLELGMSGADVSALQSFLARDNTIYPQGLVTGYFGSLTKSAVSNFQSRNGISSIGRVGPVTLAAINRLMDGDNVSPAISSINVSPSRLTANINWNTNENASAVVYYSNNPIPMTEGSPTTQVTIGGSSALVNTNMQSSHSTTLTGLNPNTVYNYVLYVKDATGNESVTWPATFQTTP